MKAGVGLLVTDVIIPRYSHNYAQFYQLLDSNLFTHRNTYAILRQVTSETYGPGVYLPSYKFSEKNQILFIDRLDHKPTIHRISTNTPQKKITLDRTPRHRGEHGFEDQRERISPLATSYGAVGLW